VLSTNQKGALAEMKIATEACELGVAVLHPMQEHGRYDLAFEISRRVLRVQCKWGALDEVGSVVRVNLQTYSLTYGGQRHTSYSEDEIDLLAVYCGGLDRCYLLPSALVANRRQIFLRLTSARNGQRACINLAGDFEFAGAIAQLEERLRGTQEAVGSSPTSSTSPAPGHGTHVVGCHEFRNHFGFYLEQAAAGHEVEISRRGRPHARLVPAQQRLVERPAPV
jgi:prevent-host-death family protein